MAWHVPSTNGHGHMVSACLWGRNEGKAWKTWAMLPCGHAAIIPDHPTSGSLPKLVTNSQHMSTLCLQKTSLSVPPKEDPELTADQNRRHRSGEACLLNLMPAGPWSRKWHNSRSQMGHERLNISQPQKRKNQATGWFGVRVWVNCFCWVMFRVFREYVVSMPSSRTRPCQPTAWLSEKPNVKQQMQICSAK